ncbi:manganese-dependent inorganic pyrophosphatase [Vibrio sp. JCM 19236]|nr:manganese-dependent inorganic pyrophosphatase [Vibrio sp. JCM 19236]
MLVAKSDLSHLSAETILTLDYKTSSMVVKRLESVLQKP